jgi:hypothetical protein
MEFLNKTKSIPFCFCSNLLSLLKAFPKKVVLMTIWQKLLLIISALFFIILFIENFIFSSSFALLHIREIDDTAFQASIRVFHQDISAFRLDRFIKLNDYGYGWIFWVIVGLITYPFYLLALVTDFYVPLIAIPRDISLLFTIGTVFFVYKSLSVYSKNEFLKFIAILLLLSFPAFGYFALRFGTVSQVMFFSSLTFYLAIKKDSYDKNDLKKIALAAAACVGTKLNGALILPLIGIIMADRLQWNVTKDNAKKAGYFLLNLIFFAILFSNPSLFLSPFKPDYLSSYLDSIKNNSHLSLQNNFSQTLQDVVEIGYLNFCGAALAIGFFILNIFSNNRHKKDFIFIALWLVISVSLLSKVMSMGSLYIINYTTVVMYLLVFSILYLERWGRAGSAVAIMLLMLSLFVNHKNITSGFYSSFKYFQMNQDPDIVAKIEAKKVMQNLILDPKNNLEKPINVLMDFRAIFPYANLERNNVNVQFSFDNLQVFQNHVKGGFDYVSLNKDSPFFLSDSEFAEFIKKENNEILIINQVESRKIVQNLIKNGKIENNEYNLVFDSNNIILFEKK